jgi:TolB-like protein/DNA-binding winged helix-turn-helix (wHTH) protein
VFVAINGGYFGMTPIKSAAIRFSGLTLDLEQGRLWGPAGDVALRPKSFAVLSHLVGQAGRVVSKDELMAIVWPHVTVTEDSLTQCIKDVRQSLGQAAATRLRTVPRRGYLFDLMHPAQAGVAGVNNSLPLPIGITNDTMPGSIAVMPFTSLTRLAKDDRLMFDGLVHDVISRLAQLRSFHVIARGSTFALRHLAGDPRQVGKILGVAYIVSGLIERQRAGFCLRVDLVATDGGAIVWTDEFRLEDAEFLAVIGDLTDRITGTVSARITSNEKHRARPLPDQSLTAWQAYHRGLEHFAIYSEASLSRACRCFMQATELDPGFVRAFAALSDCQATLSRALFCRDAKSEAVASLRTAEHAMRLDETAPSAQFAYSHARWLHGDIDAALVHARKSVELSPSFAEGFAEIGFHEAHSGDPSRALPSLARAELLNPLSPFIDSLHIDRAVAHVQLAQWDKAALWARAAVNRPGSHPQMQVTGAMLLGASGCHDEANAIVTTLNREGAVYDPTRIFKPPFNLLGPAEPALRSAVSALGL